MPWFWTSGGDTFWVRKIWSATCHCFPFRLWIVVVAPNLISYDDGLQKDWIFVIRVNEILRSVHSYFLLLVGQWRTKRDQVLRLQKFSWMMVLPFSLLILNSVFGCSASVSPAIIHGFLPYPKKFKPVVHVQTASGFAHWTCHFCTLSRTFGRTLNRFLSRFSPICRKTDVYPQFQYNAFIKHTQFDCS